MAGLTGKTIASSYKSLLRVEDNSNGVDTALTVITDGEGTSSGLLIADNGAQIKPSLANNDMIFTVKNYGGSYLFRVDANNSVVKANLGQDIINTQYAYFNVSKIDSANYADDTHQSIPFAGNGHGDLSYPPEFGTGTDPATSFTTAEANGTRASDLVPCLWYIQDNIAIDAITSIEGAGSSTGDTTRMHLFQYTFNSGSTSALASGTVVAHNSDVTNAGSEQAYKTTWTIDSADVDAGKVILAFIKSDSINSDYSINITVKYHLR